MLQTGKPIDRLNVSARRGRRTIGRMENHRQSQIGRSGKERSVHFGGIKRTKMIFR